MLLAAEEYVLEYLSEAEEPEGTAAAIAHLLATAASLAGKQAPEHLALTVLISLAQMTGPLVRRLPANMGQVGTGPAVMGFQSAAWCAMQRPPAWIPSRTRQCTCRYYRVGNLAKHGHQHGLSETAALGMLHHVLQTS